MTKIEPLLIEDPLKQFILTRMTAEMSDISSIAENYVANEVKNIAKAALGIDTSFGRIELKDSGVFKQFISAEIQKTLENNENLKTQIVKMTSAIVEKMVASEMEEAVARTVGYAVRNAMAGMATKIIDDRVSVKKDEFEQIVKMEINRICNSEMQIVINKMSENYR